MHVPARLDSRLSGPCQLPVGSVLIPVPSGQISRPSQGKVRVRSEAGVAICVGHQINTFSRPRAPRCLRGSSQECTCHSIAISPVKPRANPSAPRPTGRPASWAHGVEQCSPCGAPASKARIPFFKSHRCCPNDPTPPSARSVRAVASRGHGHNPVRFRCSVRFQPRIYRISRKERIG